MLEHSQRVKPLRRALRPEDRHPVLGAPDSGFVLPLQNRRVSDSLEAVLGESRAGRESGRADSRRESGSGRGRRRRFDDSEVID
jgi:hypothetical protein